MFNAREDGSRGSTSPWFDDDVGGAGVGGRGLEAFPARLALEENRQRACRNI